MQNKNPAPKANYFIFMVLILYVMIASSALKNFNVYLQGLPLSPGWHLAASLAALGLLGAGLVLLNKWLQNWLSKKVDK
ncbi:hypothetical protein [Desulforamulus hydrothermalis]|uniref:Uncharacterized protein n=1 Tax=Desulforamulus hydrothermalis Lam5 = DSM 18033 TaxID=1121428 RepID=K8DYZ5_9FIRM|nr:hypothetical protein [Desulforamulus hydrothermalis]CCO08207.1 conserved hypothetical protein [Desulforamulus hydrothermalis Lam5 = DSM 18033]SHH22445.1 hypothetical protein SAMN02745177_01873 [Desulforamulus hydrothermalis Lam5 = DSM 18033]